MYCCSPFLTGKAKPESQWLGLKVLRIKKEQADQDVGYVEFAAFYKTNDTQVESILYICYFSSYL